MDALIGINFMLGNFHQPKSTLHKKGSNFCRDKSCVSESIPYMLEGILSKIPHMLEGILSKIPPNA